MLNTAIADHRAQAVFKRYLRNTKFTDEEKAKLHGFIYCGSKIIKIPSAIPAVFVVNRENENGDDAFFYGNAHCHSPWACPYCTARVMAQKGTRIAAAIEALKEQNQSPMMITFTMPHLQKMSCSETYTILQKAWRHFSRNARRVNYAVTTYVSKKTGETKIYRKGNDVYPRFKVALESVHHVRIYEFTWGKNGWHPHIHALFWCSNDKFDKALDFEAEMNSRWLECVELEAKALWRAQNPNATVEQINAKADELFRADNRDKHAGLTISKDANGKPRKISSSLYVSGWSGDVEMTRTDLKKASNGHYTPHQLIENALNAETYDEAKPWLKLFTEYALTTRSTRRIAFSQTGLNKIIDEWLAKNSLPTVLKKKDTAPSKRRVVCWFNENQWWLICNLIEPRIHDIKVQILERARLPNGKEQITQLLLENNIDIRDNGEHKLINHIETKVFSQAVA